MNKECLQILKKIAANHKNDGDFSLFQKVLSRIYNYKKGPYKDMDVSVFDNIWDEPIDSVFLEENLETDQNFKDLRLLTLEFQNFRTFPLNEPKYGLRFERNGNPCSTFLVGRNSTGKSTIFSAIEYFFAHKVSNAELKNITDIKWYLTNIYSQSDVRLFVQTKADSQEKEYNLNETEVICTPAMFCSDNDIYKIGNLEDENLIPFIIDQLGYTDLKIVKEKLQEIINYKIEVHSVNKVYEELFMLRKVDLEDVLKAFIGYYDSNEKGDVIELCEKYMAVDNGIAVAIHEEIKNPSFLKSKNIKQKFFKEDWDSLRSLALWSNVEGAVTDIENAEKKLAQKYKCLKDLLDKEPTKAISLYEEWKKTIEKWFQKPDTTSDDFNSHLLVVLNNIITDEDLEEEKIVRNFTESYHKFIEDSLKYFSEEYETFKLIKHELGKVEMKIFVAKNGEAPESTSPAMYLNSFRFKLYSIALKLSLAFYYMKINRNILPIAIDDVFNANDFDNSIHLQYFVHKIYELYHEKVSQTIPLQLIMLTHDEIILSAFQKGYNAKEIIKWNESQENKEKSRQKYCLYKDNCIIGRLNHYEEAKFIHENNENPKLDNTSHNNSDFYNLYNVINYYG